MENRISGNCLANGERSCLGNFTLESSAVMIEKTLRHQTTSEHLLFSSWFIIHVFPQWTVRALLTADQMQKTKRQSWVANLWHVCPERHAQNKHKSCICTWSLLRALLCIKTQFDSGIMCVCVCGFSRTGMNRMRIVRYRRIILRSFQP